MTDHLIKRLYPDTYTVKCHKCGKTMEMPNMMRTETRSSVLSPYCCTFTLFCVQWMICHGWHVRNLGITDSHPYFCSDCWEEGTSEYSKSEYAEQWCKQAETWQKSKNHSTEGTK